MLAEIDEEIVRAALGKPREGKAQCFEDQYISTGGQLYELMAGHDRFIADIRPLMSSVMKRPRSRPEHLLSSVRLCTELIAREFGVMITGRRRAAARLNRSRTKPMSHGSAMRIGDIGQIEPLLQAVLTKTRTLAR